MKDVFLLLVSAIFVNNFVLSKFLGICPFLGVSKKLDSAVGMGAAVTLVMLLATLVTYPVYALLLVPNELEYLQTIVFILVIASFVQLLEIIMRKYLPALHRTLGVYLPLITTNCAVLGVTILNIDEGYTFFKSMVYSFGAGLGFLLAMVIFAGIRTKLEAADIPQAFKGMPITLVAAAIVSLAFFGFAGIGA
ncbi:MAG: electron transport complex subunit RsxA [Peptococcaceae bacterium]|jgi:electron transport complex protein RnfA|nr:electron transport complex subunit RsxA [Peptococcaceae bacterium]